MMKQIVAFGLLLAAILVATACTSTVPDEQASSPSQTDATVTVFRSPT